MRITNGTVIAYLKLFAAAYRGERVGFYKRKQIYMTTIKFLAAVLSGRVAALGAAIAFLVPLALPAASVASTCTVSNHIAAENFIRDLHERVSGKGGQARNSAANLNAFIRAKVPVKTVSRSALGVHWRRASMAQRAEYQHLFEKTVFPGLAGQILRYRNADYKIVDNRALQSNDRLVTANVKAGQATPLKVGWRLRFDDCNATATDMIVDGVSLTVMKRQEFAAVISAHGIDGLISKMRKKADQMKSGGAADPKMSQAEMGEIVQDLLRGAAAKVR